MGLPSEQGQSVMRHFAEKTSKQRPEVIWMAWSPNSNYLPQAASVDRRVCQEMIRQRGWSRAVKCVRVLVQPASKSLAGRKKSD
jgi:hypothetical protein